MIYIEKVETVKFANYTKEEQSQILEELKFHLRQNTFYIVPRDKNCDFMRTFSLNKSKVRDLLLEMKEENFCNKTLDRNQNDMLVIFKFETELINFYGETEKIKIYVKYAEKTKGKIPVISFHEDELKG